MYAGTLFGDNKHEAPRSAEHRELWNREWCLRLEARESGAEYARESGTEYARESGLENGSGEWECREWLWGAGKRSTGSAGKRSGDIAGMRTEITKSLECGKMRTSERRCCTGECEISDVAECRKVQTHQSGFAEFGDSGIGYGIAFLTGSVGTAGKKRQSSEMLQTAEKCWEQLGVGGRMGNKDKLEGKWKCGEIGSEVVRSLEMTGDAGNGTGFIGAWDKTGIRNCSCERCCRQTPGNGFAEMAEGMRRRNSTPEIDSRNEPGYVMDRDLAQKRKLARKRKLDHGVWELLLWSGACAGKRGKLCGKRGKPFWKGVLGFRKLEWRAREEYKAGEGHEIRRLEERGKWCGGNWAKTEFGAGNFRTCMRGSGKLDIGVRSLEQEFPQCYEHSEEESGDSDGIQVPVNISGPAESDKKLFGESMWVKKAQASTELGAEVMQQ
ncbi:hypothetical protein JOM56_012971 [Amanita muscaria]